MTGEQARDLQHEMQRLQKRWIGGHVDPEDMLMLGKVIEEMLAHMAAALEAREKVPRRA